MDHQQHDQSVRDYQMCQGERYDSPAVACSQPHMVECSEAVDTSNSTELVGLPSTTNPQFNDTELAIRSLLAPLMIYSGGQIESVSSSRVIIKIDRQTIVIVFTQDTAVYEDCLQRSKGIELPDCVAKCQNYLATLNVPSAAVMIHNVPTIVGLVLLPTSTMVHMFVI